MSVFIRCVLLGLLALANVATVADDIIKEIDLRSDEGKKAEDAYFIVFSAYKADIVKGSFAGHAYVGFGKEDQVAKQSTYSAYGLYPKEGIGWVGPVPGKIVDDTRKKSELRLIVRVDQEAFDVIEEFKDQYIKENGEGQYQLGRQDCVTFSSEVAHKLGLKVVERKETLFPSSFLRALIEANRDKAKDTSD